jgi:hypothetical protein
MTIHPTDCRHGGRDAEAHLAELADRRIEKSDVGLGRASGAGVD